MARTIVVKLPQEFLVQFKADLLPSVSGDTGKSVFDGPSHDGPIERLDDQQAAPPSWTDLLLQIRRCDNAKTERLFSWTIAWANESLHQNDAVPWIGRQSRRFEIRAMQMPKCRSNHWSSG